MFADVLGRYMDAYQGLAAPSLAVLWTGVSPATPVSSSLHSSSLNQSLGH